MACLAPIWNTKRETARRVRQRISRIMLWCIAQGYRQDNPAGDAVAAALPRGRGGPRNHQRALPYSRVPDALGKIRSAKAQPAARLGLEFLVLTAARSGEVRGAPWKEIDLETRTWTVPARRMKARCAHRVRRRPDARAAAYPVPAAGGTAFGQSRRAPVSTGTP